MTQELAGRVALVTGAGRNIGRAIALALADAGAAVVINARSNLREAEAVAGEIERAGGKAFAVAADVVDAAAVQNMVDAAAARFGRIDILVNNAAVRAEQPLETMTLTDWRAVTGIIEFFNGRAAAEGEGHLGPLHDPCVIAHLLRPALFEGMQAHVQVDIHSELTMGMTLIDRRLHDGHRPNCQVLHAADADGFFALLTERLARL